jgi:hypothetical protein
MTINEIPFTPRNVAKFVAQSGVAHYVEGVARNAITDYTRFEDGDLVTKLGPKVIGWGVATQLKPYTDAAVDKTADFIVAKREARKAKKNTKQD